MAAFSNCKERIHLKDKLVVIDCQNDFITGSLACFNAISAVKYIVDYINKNEVNVYYSMDWHSNNNKSFTDNGGIWPVHCVRETFGAKLYKDFYSEVMDEENKPNENNMYYKGLDDTIEEYSAYNAKNSRNVFLSEEIGDSVIICGIASEYCVRETVLEFRNANKKVYILSKGLGYVDINGHVDNINKLKDLGVVII